MEYVQVTFATSRSGILTLLMCDLSDSSILQWFLRSVVEDRYALGPAICPPFFPYWSDFSHNYLSCDLLLYIFLDVCLGVMVKISLSFFFFSLIALSSFLSFGCHVWAFSSYGKWGPLFVVVCGLLLVVASLVEMHRLWVWGLQWLQHSGSVVVVHGPRLHGLQ